MTPQEQKGSGVALVRAIGRRLYDMSGYQKPSFFGILQGYSTFYNQKGRGKTFDKVALKGGPMAVDWTIGKTEWQGTRAGNPDIESRRLPWTDNVDVIRGSVLPAAHEVVEAVDRYKVNRLTGTEPVSNYVQLKADKLVDGYVERTNKDLFPAVNLVAGAGTAPGTSKASLMPIAYPLQSGYAGNEANGAANRYEYIGHDLNALPEAKALNVGSDSTPWVVTPRKIQDDILMPLREERGANIDLAICGKEIWSYLAAFFEGKTILNDYKMFVQWGVRFFEIDGVPFIYEPRMNLLPKREIYFLDVSTWKLGMDEDPAKSLVYMENIPGMPSISGYQGYVESAVFCESPRQNGRAYNVQIPN